MLWIASENVFWINMPYSHVCVQRILHLLFTSLTIQGKRLFEGIQYAFMLRSPAWPLQSSAWLWLPLEQLRSCQLWHLNHKNLTSITTASMSGIKLDLVEEKAWQNMSTFTALLHYQWRI